MRMPPHDVVIRQRIMRAVGSKNTGPELVVRGLLHRLGYRFRLHDERLPGRPDIVFPARRKVIFVHGCFWHQHSKCPKAGLPKSGLKYWIPKLARNRERDHRAVAALEALGWSTFVIWQCQINDEATLRTALL